MSIPHDDAPDGARTDARALMARVAAACMDHGRRRSVPALDDLLAPDQLRLDDRSRAAIAEMLRACVRDIEGDLRRRTSRLLSEQGRPEIALRVISGPPVFDRLVRAGLLRLPALLEEVTGATLLRLIAADLPTEGAQGSGSPSLLVRLAESPVRAIAGAARELLVAESGGAFDLPAPVRDHLLWSIAAVIREGSAGEMFDQAVVEAVTRNAAEARSGIGQAAMALAAAIAAEPAELPTLLEEALGDRRLALYVALVAHACGMRFADTRELVLENPSERLWLALRSLELPRPVSARLAVALAEADPRRDLEAFADTLEFVMTISPEDARAAIHPMTLDGCYRGAIRALAR